ncbi:hypothetical protein ABEF95_007330 [Exophiala dermatitidis]
MRRASMSWLWKGDANSPASFEKALSKLSAQISSASLALDTTRSRGRRVKALWTLYTTLTYLLYTLIIGLVLGPQNWSPYHYAGLVGAPVLIYVVRTLLTAFFDWRISRQQSHLDRLQKQREQKIAELKKATKYDSTQELLQKYGGAPPTKTPSRQLQSSKRKIKAQETPQPQRTGIAPPPTANIPGRNISTPPLVRPPLDSNPVPPIHGRAPSMGPMLAQSPVDVAPEPPGFAPNAFPQAPPPNTAYEHTPHWYDRILDVMLGEDETAAKNRLVLLCSRCRLVNGQAPPGVKTLEELGRWRCSGCGAWNGVESEGAKVVKEIAAASAGLDSSEEWEDAAHSAETHAESSEEFKEEEPVDSITHGTTGRDADDESGLAKRVARSAGRRSSDTLECVDGQTA